MKRLVITCAVLAIALPAWAQKIETQKPDRTRVVHVETALNHLTVIEVGEAVTEVAAGSAAFKVEWRGNRVFIQPTEPSVATNLFVWTATGRLNYELDPAGTVETMDFAIDNPTSEPPHPRPISPAATVQPAHATGVTTDALLGGKPVRMDESTLPKKRVAVVLKDVFEQGDQLFIRYAIQNDSKHTYELKTPEVFALNMPKSPKLHRLANWQIRDMEHLNSKGQTPVQVLNGEVRSARVEPGQETVGVVAVKLPATNRPTVLRLLFASDGRGPITATLVL